MLLVNLAGREGPQSILEFSHQRAKTVEGAVYRAREIVRQWRRKRPRTHGGVGAEEDRVQPEAVVQEVVGFVADQLFSNVPHSPSPQRPVLERTIFRHVAPLLR